MKTTSRILTGCVATGLALATAHAYAAPHCGAWSCLWAVAATAESDEQAASAEETRRRAAELLSRARQAMDEGNFETAESLLSRAEAMKPTYGLFHGGDTPKKVRRDLERQRKARSKQVKRPSQMFAGSRGTADRESGPQDPFAARRDPITAPPAEIEPLPDPRGLDAPPADAGLVPGLAGRQPFPAESPFGQPAMTAPPGDRLEPRYPGQIAGPGSTEESAAGDNRAASDRLLLDARRALAVGDVRRASEFAAQAKALGVEYGFHDDTPARVESAIQQYSDLTQRSDSDKNTQSYRRQYSQLLMQQAEALLAWQEFGEAERLAQDAGRLDVTYGPFDAKPSDMLKRIVAMRRQASGGGFEPLPPVTGTASPAAPPAGAAGSASSPEKSEVLRLVEQARTALEAGDVPQAEALARQAESLNVPDSAFAPDEDRPWLVLYQIQQLRRNAVVPAGAVTPIDTMGSPDGSRYATQAMYDRSRDTTRNVQASSEEAAASEEEDAFTMFMRGEEALRQHDSPGALEWFRRAYARRDELDPDIQQRLQDYLQLAPQAGGARQPAAEMSPIDQAAAAQQLLYRQVSWELSRQEERSRKLLEVDPKQALEILQQARASVEQAGLDARAQEVLLRRVDRGVSDLERYIESHRPRIELAERNKATLDEIEREQLLKVEIGEKLALKVDEFNRLMHERRFPEAEVVAKQAAELAPNEPVVLQLKEQLKFVSATENSRQLRELSQEAYEAAMDSIEWSKMPFDDRQPYVFGDPKKWETLTKSRSQYKREGRARRSEKELEIEQRLRTPVSCRFREAPLSQVVESLGKLAQINVYLDERGLSEEGVMTDTPVSIDLGQDIMLKSALGLILERLNLSYVIKNEVLMITSEQLRHGDVYPVTYYVADLVSPIPNFQPNGRMGLAGALHDAQGRMPLNAGGFGGGSPMPVLASNDGAPASAMLDARLLAQISSASGSPIATGGGRPIGYGPGGLGGAAEADFESLIELITSTISPDSWDEVGGPGAIQEFEGNLSLVISQTQEVHEEIADLLEQLRRLQDLQVTIEVRFITLNDNFFERIGIDFDFDINDNIDKPFQIFGRPDPAFQPIFGDLSANGGVPRDVIDRDLQSRDRSVTVGLGAPGVFSADMDIPFAQNNFGLAVPQFGGFQPDAGASLGFAILSDLEAYFFIQAAQGDRRSNVLQAPKVTLFNGQQAFVADVSQSPFVISLIPVVGDFAAAQQPVIVVLNEGTQLTVQAVVSNDRRFVRLTVVPFFSRIGAVNTFTFEGSSTTTEESDSEGPDDETTRRGTRKTTSSQGTTVQLPTFSFVNVTTTVSVPDGGTVLLGGIKRLSEGRNEFGVPILNKLPYVKRLFSNVGIGRETQSLMMMVTPRIIIQEEEEALLGIPPSP